MKFFFISESGDSLSIALRIKDEGNQVCMWIRDRDCQEVGQGLIEHVTDLKDISDKSIIVCDTVEFGSFCSLLAKAGHRVIGGAMIADRLEGDRAYAKYLMHKAEIATPQSWEFDSFDDALEFIRKHKNQRFALKPTGLLAGAFPSYVSDSADDLLEELDKLETTARGEPLFEIQEFIEGTALSLEGWFNGTKFLRPFNHTLERKQLANGDLGQSTGCAGNVVWSKPEDCDCLDSFAEVLGEGGYVGPLDLNSIVTSKGEMYGLEFTPRFGYDAAPTLFTELFDGDVGKFFHELSSGRTFEMPLRSGYALGVRVTTPPWPQDSPEAEAGLELRELDLEHFAPYEVRLSDDERYVTSGGHGMIGIACGHGETISLAGASALNVAKKLKLRNKHYRTDLVECFEHDAEMLDAADALEVQNGE